MGTKITAKNKEELALKIAAKHKEELENKVATEKRANVEGKKGVENISESGTEIGRASCRERV